MFRRIFGKDHEPAADQAEAALTKAVDPNGDTATVRRIVAKLEAMPPERARLVASAAYTVARAAYADLVISDDEADVIERELQDRAARWTSRQRSWSTEMARLQAKTVGGTEDYVVTREFKALGTDQQSEGMLRACFAVGAASGSISAEESADVNQIANELDIEPAELNTLRAEFTSSCPRSRPSAGSPIRPTEGRASPGTTVARHRASAPGRTLPRAAARPALVDPATRPRTAGPGPDRRGRSARPRRGRRRPPRHA